MNNLCKIRQMFGSKEKKSKSWKDNRRIEYYNVIWGSLGATKIWIVEKKTILGFSNPTPPNELNS